MSPQVSPMLGRPQDDRRVCIILVSFQGVTLVFPIFDLGSFSRSCDLTPQYSVIDTGIGAAGSPPMAGNGRVMYLTILDLLAR